MLTLLQCPSGVFYMMYLVAVRHKDVIDIHTFLRRMFFSVSQKYYCI